MLVETECLQSPRLEATGYENHGISNRCNSTSSQNFVLKSARRQEVPLARNAAQSLEERIAVDTAGISGMVLGRACQDSGQVCQHCKSFGLVAPARNDSPRRQTVTTDQDSNETLWKQIRHMQRIFITIQTVFMAMLVLPEVQNRERIVAVRA